MSIETFTKEQFETYLSQSHSPFESLGLIDGEYAYKLSLDGQSAIMLRSSIKSDGVSASTGKDSVRAWLVGNDGKPLGSKVSKWTNRLPGWESRLTDVIKTICEWRAAIGDCPDCDKPKSVFKSKTASNKGRIFAKCRECDKHFIWLDEITQEDKNNVYFSTASHSNGNVCDVENVAHQGQREQQDVVSSGHPNNGDNDSQGSKQGTVESSLPSMREPNPEQRQAIEAPIDANVRVLAPPGSGKCITGDSLVLTDIGLVQIQDCDHYIKVVDQTMSLVDVSNWLDMGISKTIKITTKSGYTIEGTPEHPVQILAYNKIYWKRLDEITPIDNIALAWDTQQFGYMSFADDSDLPYIMGQLIADGNVGGLNSPTYIGLHRSGHLADIFKSWANIQGYNVRTNQKKGTNSVSHIFHSRHIVDTLTKLGYPIGKLARDKEIPIAILRGTSQTQRAFLQGYFDLESYCGKRNLEVVTASEKLGRQIQIMLLNFGIRVSRQPKHVNGYNHIYWRLTISGDALRTFAERIGYKYAVAKKHNLENAIAYASNSNQDVFPLTPYYFKEIREKYKKLKIWNGHGQYAQLNNGKFSFKHWLQGDRDISRLSLKTIADTTGDKLARFLTDNILIDQVESIESGQAHVYDFTVPQTHSFVANGFINHNTFIIEHRYNHLVQNGVNPNKILVVTFSKQMADEMGQRIQATCPIANLEQISTIHALCYRLLCKWDVSSPYFKWEVPKDWRVRKELEDIMGQIWSYGEKPGYSEVLNYIDTSKYLGLTVDESYEWFCGVLGNQYGEWLYEIRSRFDAWLQRNRSLTFADMLYLVEQKLKKDKAWRDELQRKFTYVICDEAQDTAWNAMRILITIGLEPGQNTVYEIGGN